MSTKQIAYAKRLRDVLGAAKAREISLKTLEDVTTGRRLDAFEEVPDGLRPWTRKERMYRLTSDEGSKLINALLEEAGRKGRRRNNRVNNAGRF
jgi:hypothetical protein